MSLLCCAMDLISFQADWLLPRRPSSRICSPVGIDLLYMEGAFPGIESFASHGLADDLPAKLGRGGSPLEAGRCHRRSWASSGLSFPPPPNVPRRRNETSGSVARCDG